MIEIDSETWVTTTKAAEILGTTPKAVRKLVASGRLQRYRKALIKENLYRLEDVQALRLPKA